MITWNDPVDPLDPRAAQYRQYYEYWNQMAHPEPLSWWERVRRFWTK